MRWLLVVALVGCGSSSTSPKQPTSTAVNPGTPQVFAGSFKVENKPDEEKCRSFKQVAQDLVVEAPGLTKLNLRGVKNVGDDLFIASNTALTDLDLGDLTIIGGGLFIWDNDVLADTSGLRNVRAIGGALHITNNRSLARLILGAVSGIGTVRITSNPKLADLSGLARIEFIAGDLIIANNAALAKLPFGALQKVKGNIRIEGNPKLPACRAEALVQRLRDAGYEGNATVADNDDDATCA